MCWIFIKSVRFVVCEYISSSAIIKVNYAILVFIFEANIEEGNYMNIVTQWCSTLFAWVHDEFVACGLFTPSAYVFMCVTHLFEH